LYYIENDAERVAEGQRAAHARYEAARANEAAEREAKTLANEAALTAESAGGSGDTGNPTEARNNT
jgi:hypothetical protein